MSNLKKAIFFSVSIHAFAAIVAGLGFLDLMKKEPSAKEEIRTLNICQALPPKTPSPTPLPQKILPKEPFKPMQKPLDKAIRQEKQVIAEEPQKEEQKEEYTENREKIEHNVSPPQVVEQKIERQAIQANTAANNLPAQKRDEAKEYLSINAQKIREAVLKYKKYPTRALKIGAEGTCIVSFRILENGDIEDIKVVKSSGYASLDKSSIETVEEAQKELPKAPKGGVTIVVPIEYKLN